MKCRIVSNANTLTPTWKCDAYPDPNMEMRCIPDWMKCAFVWLVFESIAATQTDIKTSETIGQLNIDKLLEGHNNELTAQQCITPLLLDPEDLEQPTIGGPPIQNPKRVLYLYL